MKSVYSAISLGLMAAAVKAQINNGNPAIAISFEQVASCSTPVSASVVTRTETQTYCDECEHHRPTPPAWTPTPSPPVWTPAPAPPEQTVYTTVFKDLCPTGVISKTYTITEACPCTAPRPPHHMPSGFTSTVKSCHTCGPTPITETCTVPIETAPAPPAWTAPAPPAETVPAPPAWTAPAPPAPAAPESSIISVVPNQPAPLVPSSPAPTVPAGVAPVGTGVHPIPPKPSAPGSTVTPFTGGAGSVFSGAGIALSLVAGVFGAIAVAL
ncbi:hypothetical protein DTO207G8_6253 [Paecilomyces variotii]|nr:hypothetical protein DTO207G8_6253 [Paecilomyces variotii]KAJ9360417.1 hypothetical protein DTO027B9_1401 [Paecilomyces variotii]KAJ9406758.1 hypothetical protein DTO045G8_5424 [Paecilomyces variotii]